MQTSAPIPHDLPLDLPAPAWLLQGLLVAFFIAHILFVNLMLGGALLTVYFQRLSARLREPKYDALARAIAETITVNKSVAVVLGVGPLLAMNVLYTTHFYSANALTGAAWIAIIPMAIIAFLLLYWHKYSWDAMARHKLFHRWIAVFAVLLLLAIPAIFLTNINLMLFPEKWGEVRGFWSALKLPNVLPRYAHFVLASVSATSLFGAWYFGRTHKPVSNDFGDLAPPMLRRSFYRITWYATCCQFVAGPTVLLTLPERAVSGAMFGTIIAGATMAAIGMMFLWSELQESDETIGRGYWIVVTLFAGTVVFMATGRHFYRENALRDHRHAIASKTREFLMASQAAYREQQAELAKFPPEQRLFQSRCGACHAIDVVRVGPPLSEIARIYQNRPEGIVAWAMAPGKKRANFLQMPSMKHVGEQDLAVIAQFMLRAGAAHTTSPPAPPAP